MKDDSARYVKFVTWSDDDQVYIGSCPGLFYAGCHGDNEREVFDELCVIVDEWIENIKADGKELPAETASIDFSSFVQQSVA